MVWIVGIAGCSAPTSSVSPDAAGTPVARHEYEVATGKMPPGATPGDRALSEPMVNVRSVDSNLRVDLRYATSDNVVGRPLYPSNMVCQVRRSVALRLKRANQILATYGYALKIWDGYRPLDAQRALFETSAKGRYVGNPDRPQHCLHNWGVAVDATLVMRDGGAVVMPTGFDTFESAAALDYRGDDPEVRRRLKILQGAMGAAGFVGIESEWWHFVAEDWQRYGPYPPLPSM